MIPRRRARVKGLHNFYVSPRVRPVRGYRANEHADRREFGNEAIEYARAIVADGDDADGGDAEGHAEEWPTAPYRWGW